MKTIPLDYGFRLAVVGTLIVQELHATKGWRTVHTVSKTTEVPRTDVVKIMPRSVQTYRTRPPKDKYPDRRYAGRLHARP